VETRLKFADFQAKLKRDLKESNQRLLDGPGYDDPARLPALILAYVGDAVFSLHVRMAMLSVESNKVQILHTLLARMASASLQARALFELELQGLTELELAVIRRGRNAKGRVPRNASVAEYRSSTALEALLGYLYLSGEQERLQLILGQIVDFMCSVMASEMEGSSQT
jgi:ribonuclease III family protein